MAAEDTVPEMVLNITEVARQKVLRVRAAENEPDTLALLVGGVAAAWLVRRRKAQSRTDGNA